MSNIKIHVSNYKNFINNPPLEITINEGINFFLGVNNVGKSNILKLIYDLKKFFLPWVVKGAIFNNEEHINIRYDVICNRQNLASPIILNIDDSLNGVKINCKLAPIDERVETNVFVSFSLSEFQLENRLKLVNLLNKSLYIPPFRGGMFQTGNPKYYDITIGKEFVFEWSEWQSGDDFLKMSRISNLINELKDLFEFKNFQINPNHNKDHLNVTTDDGIFKLEELGSGISQFIIALGNAEILKPSIILIDEPEMNLHPRLQQKFIRALASKASFGLIAASHSIGLARSSADYIYSITKSENGFINIKPFGDCSSNIDQSIYELGYSQWSELGGTKILLVEGRTDIKSFIEILRKFDLDKDFIVISFGGRQFMTTEKSKIELELGELLRLKAKTIFVIFDSEKQSSIDEIKPEFKTFKEVCVSLGFKVFPTDYHSTENYIKQYAINKILGDRYKELSPFDVFNNIALKWDKNKNWLMFREMEKEDFNGTELKKFIEEELTK